eukprot:1564527-Rhodomonas_salina.3
MKTTFENLGPITGVKKIELENFSIGRESPWIMEMKLLSTRSDQDIQVSSLSDFSLLLFLLSFFNAFPLDLPFLFPLCAAPPARPRVPTTMSCLAVPPTTRPPP